MTLDVQMDLFLANTLGITERAVKMMKAENNERYQREMIGALVLTAGVDFRDVVHGFNSNTNLTALDSRSKALLNALSTTLLLGSTPSGTALHETSPVISMRHSRFIETYLKTIFIGYVGDKNETLDFHFYTPGYLGASPVLHITTQTLLCSEYEDIDERRLNIINEEGGYKKLSEIVEYIQTEFPAVRKRTVPLNPFEVTETFKYLSPSVVKERLNRDSGALLVHVLDSVDLECEGLRVRNTGNINGSLTLYPEIEYKNEIFTFSSEDESESYIEKAEHNFHALYKMLKVDSEAEKRMSEMISKAKQLIVSDRENVAGGADCDSEFSPFITNLFTIFFDGIKPGLAKALCSVEVNPFPGWILKHDKGLSLEDIAKMIPEDSTRTFKVRAGESFSVCIARVGEDDE